MTESSEQAQPSDAIVFAIDFSEMTDFVIDAALDQARLVDAPELHAVCVLDSRRSLNEEVSVHDGEQLAELEETMIARVASAFERAGHPLDALGEWEFEAHARIGSPAAEIAGLAREVRAEVIVVGRHGHGGPREWLLGSVPSRLLQLARCDVLIVQPSDYTDA